MRLNVKKVTIAVGVLLFLWLMITYGSVIEAPRSASTKNPAVEIENRIIRLQKQMDEQLQDSHNLLEKVKKLKVLENVHVEENEIMKGDAEENAKDLEVLQSKLFFSFLTLKLAEENVLNNETEGFEIRIQM